MTWSRKFPTEGVRPMARRMARDRRHGDAPEPEPYERPKTRADCAQVPRPCPFAGCRYNLALDVLDKGGIHWNRGEDWDDPGQPLPSCALDVADQGAQRADTLGELLALRPGTFRKEEYSVMRRLKALAPHLAALLATSLKRQ